MLRLSCQADSAVKRLRSLLAALATKVSASRPLSRAASSTWSQIKKEYKQQGLEDSLNQMRNLSDDLDAIEVEAQIVLTAKQAREKDIAKKDGAHIKER